MIKAEVAEQQGLSMHQPEVPANGRQLGEFRNDPTCFELSNSNLTSVHVVDSEHFLVSVTIIE